MYARDHKKIWVCSGSGSKMVKYIIKRYVKDKQKYVILRKGVLYLPRIANICYYLKVSITHWSC